MNQDKSASVNQWVRNEILNLNAYHVPSAEGMVKLDAMENPFQLPDSLQQEWLERLSQAELNRYPDPSCGQLKSRVREVLTIPDGIDLILGNGSDELIQLIVMLVGGPGKTVVTPEPTFSMYKMISIFTDTKFVGAPLNDDFSLNREALIEAIETENPACVFLAYPNNPTGNCFDPEIIHDVLNIAPGIVVIDEAYYSFCGESFLNSIEQWPNLILLRTLSKSGLAGLRLGMLMASPIWADQIEKIRLPYNINCLSQISAEFALEHYSVLEKQSETLIAQRTKLYAALSVYPELNVYESRANFILFKAAGQSEALFSELKQRGILIKQLHGSHPALEDCLRVTVSSEAENNLFLNALKDILNRSS